MLPHGLLLLILLIWLAPASATEVPVDRFLEESFKGKPPAHQMLWLSPDLKARSARVLGHPFPGMRVKYWREGGRSAWVLDEIGKEQPITIGILIENDKIARVQVLHFRESRGGEIRYPFFTNQFRNVALKEGDQLDSRIDGITGATLSVWAVTKVSRLALMFHGEVLRAEK